MKHAQDDITVGKVTLRFDCVASGWIADGFRPIKNPLQAQRVAELMNHGKEKQYRRWLYSKKS